MGWLNGVGESRAQFFEEKCACLRLTSFLKHFFTWKPVKGSWANNADPAQTPHNVGSDLRQQCLLKVFPSKNKIKATKRPDTSKMTNGLVQRITVEESTSMGQEYTPFRNLSSFRGETR